MQKKIIYINKIFTNKNRGKNLKFEFSKLRVVKKTGIAKIVFLKIPSFIKLKVKIKANIEKSIEININKSFNKIYFQI